MEEFVPEKEQIIFERKIQNVADRLSLTPVDKRSVAFSIRGTDERWYSFADMMEAIAIIKEMGK
ncbi:MAG: hypothetical protein PHC68_16875 [Syntrophorhabdaceae bacterium]|nr:hypothetical protein [Syntrophorhabdaceae bacterium]